MLFVGTSIIHPSTEGVFLLCNILDLLIYSTENEWRVSVNPVYRLLVFGLQKINIAVKSV